MTLGLKQARLELLDPLGAARAGALQLVDPACRVVARGLGFRALVRRGNLGARALEIALAALLRGLRIG